MVPYRKVEPGEDEGGGRRGRGGEEGWGGRR